MTAVSIRIGKDGAIILPTELRERYGIHEGATFVAEGTADGVLLRNSSLPEVELYTPERIAYFLLSNTLDEEDYQRAREEVWKLGIDPDSIQHDPPCA